MDWLLPTDLVTEYAIVAVVALLVTLLTVVTHYEGVHWLARRYSRRQVSRSGDRRAMLSIMFSLLALHAIEIWYYGLAYWGLLRIPGTGHVAGEHGVDTLFDAIYLSATTYSTLGFGDLSPIGAIRMVSGMESLTGLLLITWSASFTYLEMSRLWSDREAAG